MDDLARELSISKKTLYQLFKSKEELVLSLFEEIRRSWNQEIKDIQNSNDSALFRLLKFTLLRFDYLERLNPAFLIRSRRKYQRIYQHTDDITKNIESLVLQLLTDVQSDNLLLPNTDIEAFTKAHETTFSAYLEHFNPQLPGSRKMFEYMIIAPIAGIVDSSKADLWSIYNQITP